MAVYMSASRQRRRTVLIAATAALAGLILGVLLGRTTASGVSEALDASRSRGRSLASALRALPIEYERELSLPGQDISAIQDAARRVAAQADDTLAKAPWLGPGARKQVTDGVTSVQRAIQQRVNAQKFQQISDSTANIVDDVFSVPNTAGS